MLIGRTRSLFAALAFAGAAIAAPTAAFGQSTTQFPVQFNFLTPGARSLAMGGAFVGAADDATAAFVNPAGLAYFGTRQVTFEGRFNSVDTPFLAGGRISGQPTRMGIDTIPNPVYETDVYSRVRPSFLAVVLPIGGRSSFTAYRHELVDTQNTFYSRGVFERVQFLGSVDDRAREVPLGGTRIVRVVNYGGAFGRIVRLSSEPGSSSIAVGGGLSLSTFHLDSQFARHGFLNSIFGPDDPTLVSSTAVQVGDDYSWSAHAGAMWHSRNDVLSVGGTFRRGPRFDFTQRDRVIAAELDLTRSGRFKVPDVWAAGIAWQIHERLRLLVDYDRVQYAQLKEDFIDIQALASGRSSQLRIDDGNEVHGGMEWRVPIAAIPLALRWGAWFDPDHTVQYIPLVSPANFDDFDRLLTATLPGGKNLVHYTFGAGIGLPANLVVDAAADVSSRTRTVTASLLVRF